MSLAAGAIFRWDLSSFVVLPPDHLGSSAHWLLWLRDGDSALDFPGHERERLLYIFAVFGRGLQEAHIIVFGQFSPLFSRNLACVLHVRFISYKDAGNVV